MSKALESALEVVRRMSPDSEIDPALWLREIETLRWPGRPIAKEKKSDLFDA